MKFNKKVSINPREYKKTQKKERRFINLKVKRENLVKV